jgi:outer membrane protein assembly factor BamB
MRKSALLLFPLALGLLAGLAVSAPLPSRLQGVRPGDWPQWRGPDRNDVSKETGLLREWPKDGPRLLWTFKDAGVGFAGIAVVGDRLYTMGAEGKTEYLYALDLNSQKKLWSVEVGPLFVNGWGDGPRGTPTVDGDLVYAIGGNGDLVCVRADKGEKVWSHGLRTELSGQMMSGWGYTESPLVDGDHVLATPGGKKGTVAAFDKKDGKLVWRSADFTDPAAYSSLIPCEIGGIRQYVQMTGQGVAGVAAKDGKLLWHYAKTAGTAAIPTPLFADNCVYVTSGYGSGCALVKLVPQGDGIKAEEVYKNKSMTNQHGGVVLVDGYLYGFSDGPGWVCQDFKTGEQTWTSRKLGKGSVVYADGHLYCYSEGDGTCALVEANPKEWKEAGRFKIPQQTNVPRKGGHIWTHPVIAHGKLYLRDQDLIFCYDVKNGSSQ